MQIISLILLILLLLFITTVYTSCDYYLAKSLVPNSGFGVFIGQDMDKNELIDSGITLIIPRVYAQEWQLHQYLFGCDHDEYSMLVFGMFMMLNHHPHPNTHHYWEDLEITDISLQKYNSTTIYRRASYYTAEMLMVGQEIYTSYGESDWFTERDITLHMNEENSTLTLQQLQEQGICLSDVIVQDSSIPGAGIGVFSTKQYFEGDFIGISPVVILPRDQVEAASDSNCVLINYCIVDPRSNVALLPITQFGLLNHGGASANVAYGWFYWNAEDEAYLHLSAEDLASHASLNLFLGYIAKSKIEAGDELTIDYGEQWETDRIGYDTADIENNDQFTLFRSPITAPDVLFPLAWHNIDEVKSDEL